MKAKELVYQITEKLTAVYAENEARSIAFFFTEEFTGFSRTEILLGGEIKNFDAETFKKYINRLINQEPVQYVVGHTWFIRRKFFVNKNVLIPRPETEELLSIIIKENQHKRDLHILDIGTGSGCIPVTLKKELQKAIVYGLDISSSALSVAKRNATENQAEIVFIEADILDLHTTNVLAKSHREGFDIIVSNPPYVMEKEKKEMEKNVLVYEPHLALFVPDENPLKFYKSCVLLAATQLKPGGKVYFEINENMGAQMKELLSHHNFNSIEIKLDFNNKVRFATAIRS